MRLNSANRAFAAAVALTAVPFVLLGLTFCGVTGLLVPRLVQHPDDAGRLAPGLLVAALLGVGVVMGGRCAVRQWRATRALDRQVRARSMPAPSRVVTLNPHGSGTVVVVDDTDAYSYAYGLHRPRVVVSRGLIEQCNDEELAAVLEHERYHVAANDPLKVSLIRMFTAAAFYLPALRALSTRYLVGRELAADRRAVRRRGRNSLAGALYRAASDPRDLGVSAAAALVGNDALELRVSQLESGEEPRLPGPSRWQLAVTLTVLAAITAALAVTWLAVGGPQMASQRQTGMSSDPVWNAFGVVACAAPWVAGAAVIYRYRRRRRRAVPLDG